MSLTKNSIANYIGQVYSILMIILIFPYYLRYLGPAAFGLVGLLTVLRSWVSLIDIGLIPAFSRQVAFLRTRNQGVCDLQNLFSNLELLLFIISFLISVCFFITADWVATTWLQIGSLNPIEVSWCVFIMGVIVCLRWCADFYRAGLIGLEQQVWLNGVVIVVATIQYVGGLILLCYFSQRPLYFFCYQLSVGLLEVGILKIRLKQLLPIQKGLVHSWRPVKEIFPLATSIAYSSVIWVALTQLDKLLLSKILTLADYGYFAIATTLANGILQIAAPISQAIIPRLTNLYSKGREQEMLVLYRNATQIVTLIILSVTGMTAVFSNELIFAWTGNRDAANWGHILFWYALGNGFIAIGAFQYYLQLIYGRLKWHVIYNTLLGLFIVPLIVFVTFQYGALGVAFTWFCIGGISFLIWPPIIHRKFAPGLHKLWLVKDILPLFITVPLIIASTSLFPIEYNLLNQFQYFVTFFCLTFFVLAGSCLASSVCRDFLKLNLFK